MGKRIALLVLLASFIVTLLLIWTGSPIIGNDYRRDVYSVIVFNNTDDDVFNISIFVGGDSNSVESTTRIASIEKISPNEYKKVNIDTSYPSPEWQIPYNVFVKMDNKPYMDTAGYFGIKTGGNALFYANHTSNGVILQRIFEHDRRYKSVYRKHLRNQNLMSWYK